MRLSTCPYKWRQGRGYTGGGGDADFSLACNDFGRMFDHSFPTRVFFLFFFKVEIRSRTFIPLFGPGSVHNGSVS